MPRYQFNCLDCQATFEEKRPIAQALAPAACPTCASNHTRKLVTAVAMHTSRATIPVPLATQGGCCGGGGCACHD